MVFISNPVFLASSWSLFLGLSTSFCTSRWLLISDSLSLNRCPSQQSRYNQEQLLPRMEFRSSSHRCLSLHPSPSSRFGLSWHQNPSWHPHLSWPPCFSSR